MVLNFIIGTREVSVEDQDLAPHAYADQFLDAETPFAQSVEELLRRARLILATEIGRDPQIRHFVRENFKRLAVVSVNPTERGVTKIDEYHPYFVRISPILACDC